MQIKGRPLLFNLILYEVFGPLYVVRNKQTLTPPPPYFKFFQICEGKVLNRHLEKKLAITCNNEL